MTTYSPFTLAVRQLWKDNDVPTVRAIAKRTQHRVSHTTVANILNGVAFPRWNTTVVVVEALRGNPQDLWDEWLLENERQEIRRQEKLRAGGRRHCETCQCQREEVAV